MKITIERPTRADVIALLDEHLHDMRVTSPPESVHALDHSALLAADVTFFTARENGALLACGALLEHSAQLGEVKSMRTSALARGKGVARAVLAELIRHGTERGYTELKLETGSEPYFAAAVRLYERTGFVVCAPFANYVTDPNSIYMARRIS